MIETVRLKEFLQSYKESFVLSIWPEEKYKWEAVKCFQDNWEINAPDFPDMLHRSLSMTKNLLASTNNFPLAMIEQFAAVAPEDVKALFIDLFDETNDVVSRIMKFKDQSTLLLERYGNGAAQHYQYENAISTYLWLRYPEKYYIYKYSEVKEVAEKLNSDYKIKKGAYADNLRNFYSLYDEIRVALKNDQELLSLLASQIDDSCYPDSELCTMTIDVGFFISRKQDDKEEDYSWFPTSYDPNISIEKWTELLNDEEVFTQSSLEIMKRLKDYGGQATCTQLAIRYGETKNFYNSGSSALAKRIVEKTGCPVYQGDQENSKWWPVLYIGRNAGKDEDGAFVWKLRDELSNALDNIDLTEINLFKDKSPSIWKISHGTDSTGIPSAQKRLFESKQVIVVNGGTKAKGKASISQGDNFSLAMKKGDYFYLCYGSNIKLLGRITSNEVVANLDMEETGWLERPYEVIAKPVLFEPYSGDNKWWTPNNNSTCVRIDDAKAFEELILGPYFDMSVSQLLGADSQIRQYWWLNANPKIWSFSGLSVGEVQSYTLYNDNGNKRRIFQNFLDAKAGDPVIAYESNPVKQIVGIGKISSEQDGKELFFEKVEGLSSPIDYETIKACPELEKIEFFVNPNGSLFKLTQGEFDFIMDMIREENPIVQAKPTDKYGEKEFLEKVFMSTERYKTLLAVLENKKNIILQGAPGVGKTYAARRLAWSIMGEQDDSRIEFVQFHQNYSYEDFIMGYKPSGEGFKLKEGIFFQFCQKAQNHPDKKYFFIIDEINRGNMSKVFGELLMLIEKDYRGTKATLAYNGMPFSVPENLYIIGMMNTADRSLAMIDYALRRRFGFFDFEPGFDSKGFSDYLTQLGNETFNILIAKIRELNVEIAQDKSLGKGFCIGHSYFCNRTKENCTEEWMKEVVLYEVLPMLKEYWFDNEQAYKRWENILNGIFQ